MTMIVVNINQVKAKLSEYLDAAARGEQVLICKRNQPVAELRPIVKARSKPRPIGLAKGRFVVPPAFFGPLPEEIVDAFAGEDTLAPQSRPSRAAEQKVTPYRSRRPRRSR